MLTVVASDQAGKQYGSAGSALLDEIVRDGVRRMLAAELQAEVAANIDAHVGVVDERGRRLVVRNGSAVAEEVVTEAGAVTVQAPRVNDKRTDLEAVERQHFLSAILPTWARKLPKVAEVLPLLHLYGLSSLDFGPTLDQLRGFGMNCRLRRVPG